MVEESFDADLHSNASCSFDRIEIGSTLLDHHKGHDEEILSILAHEFGHWKKNHLIKYLPIDTSYMVLFGLAMTFFSNDATLLTSFGFKRESYVMSCFAMYLIWSVTFDYWSDFLYRCF